MLSEADLATRINHTIEDMLAQNKCAPLDWVARAVMKEYGEITGDHADFFVMCAWKHVKDISYRAIKRWKGGEDDDAQHVLPGHKHLQRAYSVVRDGEPVIVPLELLTDAEIRGRMAEYKKMISGLRGHIKELDEYLATRAKGKALPKSA